MILTLKSIGLWYTAVCLGIENDYYLCLLTNIIHNFISNNANSKRGIKSSNMNLSV